MNEGRKIQVSLVGLLVLLWSFSAWAQQGYLHELSGNVTIAVGTAKPVTAQKNQHLADNTIVTTGPKSYAVLKFEDGTVIAIKENTSFQVQRYEYDAKAPEKGQALFSLLRGGLRIITGLITRKNPETLKVATPMATIGIRGTEFLAELVNPLYLQVVTGSITATNVAGTLVLSAGQFGSVISANVLGTVIPAAQVPPGVFTQLPQIPMPPATPAPIPPGPPPPVAPVPAAAIGAAAAAAAVAAAAGGGEGTTAHHAVTHH